MPIGYKMINGNIEIDEEQAKTVKTIFEEYTEGKSMLAIAKELTEKGIFNANKKTNWNHGSVGKILQNVKYMGDTSVLKGKLVYVYLTLGKILLKKVVHS